MPENPVPILRINVSFPESPKKAIDRKILLKKLKSWVRKEKSSLSIENVKFDRDQVYFSKNEYFFQAQFKKPIQIMFAVKDPQKNLEFCNDVANKILNFLNVILEESVSNAEVSTDYQFLLDDVKDLPKTIVGESRLAKINEVTKLPIQIKGIIFQYKKSNRSNMVVSSGNAKDINMIFISEQKMKETLPWDLVVSQYSEMNDMERIVRELGKIGD